MNRFLLDTSAYTHFKRGDAAMAGVIASAEELYLNSVVLGELRGGFSNGSQPDRNEATLLAFLSSSRVQVVPVDQDTSVYYAAIYSSLRRAGTPIPTNDIWIAASAMQHGLTLLTSDAHFNRIPQILVRLVTPS